jgi:hypothetical protein
MKKIIALPLSILVLAVICAAGCDPVGAGGEDDGSYIYDGQKIKRPGSPSEYIYIYVDFEDPENPLSMGDNTEWELRFSGERDVYTNSGSTAVTEGSGGLGGVVFSGKTDFDDTITITEAESLFEDDPVDGVDYTYWDQSEIDSDTAYETTRNAICYPGYPSSPVEGRDGLTEDTAWAFFPDADFSLSTAYAEWDRMTPNFRNYTNNVYIVRSGDGLSYYKFQIPEVDYTANSNEPEEGARTIHYIFKVFIEKISP